MELDRQGRDRGRLGITPTNPAEEKKCGLGNYDLKAN
jgi:hypothetical protein